MKIGADTATMNFIFDTGSDWFWVPIQKTGGAINCPTCQTPKQHTIASPDTSTGTFGSISYLDGSGVNGTIYNTTVTSGTVALT